MAVGFGHKLGLIGPKWDISGTFSDLISVYFVLGSKNLLKLILKTPRIVQFRANLTQF